MHDHERIAHAYDLSARQIIGVLRNYVVYINNGSTISAAEPNINKLDTVCSVAGAAS